VGVGAAVVGTAACIIAEPCGIVEGGGLAIAGVGGSSLAFGYTIVGGTAIAEGAAVGSAGGALSFAMAKKGNSDGDGYNAPRSRQAQQKSADDAWKEIQRRVGRQLTKADRRAWHDAITKQGMGYQEIVEEGIYMFSRGCGK
jgi:hypothetical protein